jgi:hypothetical protein
VTPSPSPQGPTVADIDAALAAHPPLPESARTVTSSDRKCKRHDWARTEVRLLDEWVEDFRCIRCGAIRDLSRSVRGKSARRRGNDYERELAARLGGTKVGHHGGPEDVVTSRLVIQSKVRAAFPEWMWSELVKLPRAGGRTPVLVVAEGKPAAGQKRRALAVLSLDDFRDLHGDGDLP